MEVTDIITEPRGKWDYTSSYAYNKSSNTDFEDVLKKANDTEAGLTSYLFGHDARAIARAYEVLEFGKLYVNGFSTGPMLPHCGVRESGVGCDASGWGLEEYFSLKRLSMHP